MATLVVLYDHEGHPLTTTPAHKLSLATPKRQEKQPARPYLSIFPGAPNTLSAFRSSQHRLIVGAAPMPEAQGKTLLVLDDGTFVAVNGEKWAEFVASNNSPMLCPFCGSTAIRSTGSAIITTPPDASDGEEGEEEQADVDTASVSVYACTCGRKFANID